MVALNSLIDTIRTLFVKRRVHSIKSAAHANDNCLIVSEPIASPYVAWSPKSLSEVLVGSQRYRLQNP